MAIKKDPYKVIDVPPIASPSEVQTAYRKKTSQSQSDEKMRELVEAYSIISDEEKRKEYDLAPQFQIKRSRKSKSRRTTKLTDSANKGKPTFKNSESILDRIKSLFIKKKKDDTIEYNPKEADIQYSLGLSLCDQKTFEEASEAFKKAVAYDPDFVEAYFNLGISYYKLGKWSDAQINFQKVVTFDREETVAKLLIGLLKED